MEHDMKNIGKVKVASIMIDAKYEEKYNVKIA